jgi:hypothetical protein
MSSIHDEWLGLVRPTGVVVEPRVLDDLGLAPERLAAADGLALEALLADGKLQDADALFADVLGWNAALVRGLDDQSIPPELTIRLPEHDTTLAPTYAIPEIGDSADRKWQLLIRVEEPGVTPDGLNQLPGWGASPHHRLERLLRDTGVPAGLLVTDDRVRLVTAPKGETSGWLDFLLEPMTEVAGRPILAAMKLLLGPARFFWGDSVAKLPALLRSSRQAQDNVSTELSKQVLAALHELLRGLYAADPELIAELARERPQHLYEGLLAVLMRLVFVLYAEDRDLMPSRRDGDWLSLYENSYSLRRLRERLEEDFGLYADTMDDRRGAWGQLLALFRLVANGDQWGWMQARRGKLFDPNSFPFLEGRTSDEKDASVLSVSDGCVRRILDQLVVLNGRRLSYRSLDVEQIGSVYETIMGFTVELASGPSLAIKAGKNNRTPVFVDLAAAAAVTKDRLKWLKEITGRDKFGSADAAIKAAADVQSMASALAGVVDERASPGGKTVGVGTPILQPTDERRRTGSHYTPRSLTEPIVRKALRPTFERLGPDATSADVLGLKVCDPAMGSGAFLVEACRQIAERLVAAWDRHPDERPAIPADEDEIVHARRLVAQKCIYGVDRNPMAADLAKLSLWLATLARDHEFSFLDHALKCGDSLVGLTRKQIEGVTFEPNPSPQADLWKYQVGEMLRQSIEHRQAIQAADDNVPSNQQAEEFARAEDNIRQAKIIGDAVVSCFLGSARDSGRRSALLQLAERVVASNWDAVRQSALALEDGTHPVKPFHWDIEFPEVFQSEGGGFDAVVGNPPFAGKNTIIAGNRANYLEWLQNLHEGAHGNADLVAHFFRRAFSLVRMNGTVGFIATNTISQGDTRESGLRSILAGGGVIADAVRRLKWPGEAAVVVAVVHIRNGPVTEPRLDGRSVSRISAYLMEGSLDNSPAVLVENAHSAFKGCVLCGMGFTFDDVNHARGKSSSLAEMDQLIGGNPSNREIVRPYIGGEEVLNSPTQEHRRYAIDFSDMPLERESGSDSRSWSRLSDAERRDQLRAGIVAHDYPNPVASDWPDMLSIVRARVKPERDKQTRDAIKKRWWLYEKRRPALYDKLSHVQSAIIIPQTSPYYSVAIIGTGYIFDQTLTILPGAEFSKFSVLQSRVHELWVRTFGVTLKDDLRYTPSDCYETFPFPCVSQSLGDLGERYYNLRKEILVRNKIGLTPLYKLFNKSGCDRGDVVGLRCIHDELDALVLRAYGWDDLAEIASSRFLSEQDEFDHAYQQRLFWPSDFRDEVLARLLALNDGRVSETSLSTEAMGENQSFDPKQLRVEVAE